MNWDRKSFFFWEGGDFFFFSYYIQHCFICRPSDSTVPTDAGIEPRAVATGALADALTTRLDLIRIENLVVLILFDERKIRFFI